MWGSRWRKEAKGEAEAKAEVEEETKGSEKAEEEAEGNEGESEEMNANGGEPIRPTVTVVDRSPYRRISGFDWAPDGCWLAYGYGATAHTTAIRLYRLPEPEAEDEALHEGANHTVTQPVLHDMRPSFDPEGKYLYFLSAREFNPIYDGLHFDLSFPWGMRPYLLTLQADLPNPFIPRPDDDDEPPAEPEAPQEDEQDDEDEQDEGDKGDEQEEGDDEAGDEDESEDGEDEEPDEADPDASAESENGNAVEAEEIDNRYNAPRFE